MDDIFVYYQNLPDGINEAVLAGNEGYTVYIDPRQSEEGIIRSYKHAYNHILEKDFSKTNVQEIEGNAHLKGG